ncbi:MAG: hypothetical protein WC900_10000 [Oscillospiraceae bacterium]|jgi:hypothetical protein
MTLHALKRAKERYRMALTFADLEKIINLIYDGEAKFLYDSGNCYVYSLRYNKKLIIPVISPKGTVVTFYPSSRKKEKYVNKDYEYKQKRLKGII